ncbi:MAG: tRNA (adenosine(37)-N6)-dimethylallyltransferase MiaA [Rhodocyclaceae bacterium]|nr:tRNA (adenosine(37)-N6)-dimethylallyltransferase MiaA [Rhodocyclaceae bacterium]MDZ4213588.1 tRNA (adenosine(37)-N6)-dimethylallyltransferase MiaA [Rhodocyclaceae bacterium]
MNIERSEQKVSPSGRKGLGDGGHSLPPAIALIGPTASGKTDLALDIASRFPVELISLDSAQVFIGMDIGTAKPDRATLAQYPHHLIDLITPEERYSAARFREDALRVMHEITARGRIPLLVGGTMLYYKALVEGLADMPEADPLLRAEIDATAAEQGWPALHRELTRLDPVTAARLAPNDSQRIQRALEVVRITGKPLGEHWQAQARPELPFRLLTFALAAPERKVLHERIARRFHAMLTAGLVGELEALRTRYHLAADLPSMRCVGYRHVWEVLEGQMPAKELAERGIYATRQFAKRQITWLRSLRDKGRIDGEYDLEESTTPAKMRAEIEKLIATPPVPHA